MDAKFKVGDHVRKVRGAYSPYVMVVTKINGDHIIGGSSKDLPGSQFGNAPAKEFELIKRPSKSIDDEIADLEKQLADLRAKKLEEQRPVIGASYLNLTGNEVFTVYDIYNDRVIGRRESYNDFKNPARGSLVQGASAFILDFHTSYPTKVSNHHGK